MESRNLQSTSEDFEEACFEKVNCLIAESCIPVPKVTSLSDINYRLFVLLFNAICKPKEPYYRDLKYYPRDKADEAHNVQVVIDTLSLDLLGISMSHITGEDIVAGNILAIYNLLEVLEAYMMFATDSENIPPVETNRVERSVPGVLPQPEVAMSDWICPACSHRQPFDKAIVRQAKAQIENLNCLCHNCRHHFKVSEIIESHSIVDRTFQSHARQSSSQKFTRSNQLQGASSSSSRQSDSLDDSAIPIPHPTLVDNGKLKPEFARVGIRNHSEEQTTVKTVISTSEKDFFSSLSSSREGRTSTRSSMRESSASIGTSPPLSTVIFNGVAVKKPPVASTSFASSQTEQHEREVTLPKRRFSRSMDDISFASSSKHDEMVQTSNSFLSRKSKRQRTPSEAGESINEHKRAQSLNGAHKELVDCHVQNMERKIKLYLENGIEHRRRASQINRIYQQAIKPPKRKTFSPICRKSFLLPYYLRRRTSISTPKRIHARSNSNSSQRSNRGKNIQPSSMHEQAFLRELREEFPGVYLSPGSIRKMSEKYQEHLVTLHKSVKDTLLKKSQTQVQAEEATRRQEILSNILKKEVHHVQCLNDFREHRDLRQQVVAKARDARLDSARMKQYHKEFCSDMQRKMQKRNYREEEMIKNVFDEGLGLHKEQVRLLRQQLREKEAKDARHHQIYLDSLENFYQTQFALLAESLALEKRDMQERTKAQQRVLRMIERDKRKKMENEVRHMQEQLIRNTEETHFREMDVERYRERLRDRFSAHP